MFDVDEFVTSCRAARSWTRASLYCLAATPSTRSSTLELATTAALHVYGGDYFATPRSQWDPETLAEQPFDVEHLKRVLADADEVARAAGEQ